MTIFNRVSAAPKFLLTVPPVADVKINVPSGSVVTPIFTSPATIAARVIPAAALVAQLPHQLRLGEPLLLMNTALELESGEPLVYASAREVTWPDVDAEKYGTICELQARGVVFIPTQDPPHIHDYLRDPAKHPMILTGVAASKNVRKIPTRRDSEIYRVINVEDLEDYQLVSEAAARNVGYGIIYTQDQIAPENANPPVAAAELFPDRPLDTLRHYRAQTQVLKISNGTAVIIEIKCEMAQIPVACDTAVDPGILTIFGDGFKQRVEGILKNLYEVSVGD